jgi:hypothetical protein
MSEQQRGIVILEVELHEDEEPEWAEWILRRNTGVGGDDERSSWIASGTSPSFLAALDAAANVFAPDRGSE